MSFKDRFWEKVDKGSPDECWEWQSTRSSSGFGVGEGYGTIYVDGRRENAHRVAYLLAVEDPGSKHVLHDCDNPPCVNPNHLHLGTHSDNMREMYERGRVSMAGEDNPSSKLARDEVVEIKARLREGVVHAELASEYGVSKSTISMISIGERWAEVDA